MKAAALRQSILQAAVQGKLVPQNVHDEPASKLLKRIQEEKAQFINEGKIKKEKPLPPISEDQIPYDLPGGWVWCRLLDICLVITDGDHQPPPKEESGIPFLVISNLSKGYFDFSNTRFVSHDYYSRLPADKIAKKGDILFTVTGSFGIPVVVKDERQFCFQRHIALIRPMPQVSLDFLYAFLLSPTCFMQCVDVATGTAQKTVPLTGLRSLLLPLPPLAEQRRIVDKVDELMALCDELETAENELEALEDHFATNLSKSILQAAVLGKLVLQNPHDEPVTKLLERIQQEKAQLIKEGRFNKEKPLQPIDEGAIPFEIPDNWTWVRLGDLGFTNIGLTFSPNHISKNGSGTIVLRAGNIQNGKMDYGDVVTVNMDIPDSKICSVGDILVCARNGSRRLVGKSAIIDTDGMSFGAFMALFRSSCNAYIFQLINSPYFRNTLIGDAGTTTINQLTQDMLRNFLVPLPPLTEQQRIVAKVNELMALCEELKSARIIALGDRAQVVVFATQEREPQLQMVARGGAEHLSPKAQQAIGDLFAENE